MPSRNPIPPHFHRSGMLRREVLQVGMMSAFGASMAGAFGERAVAAATVPRPRAKGVILIWMPGGPPQMQFWDPKPESPAECRGTSKPIETSAAGIRLGHRLPLIAK